MLDYQHDFIEFALQNGALRFGEFELKSGRISPYFFNAGQFQTGRALAQLGGYYAEALQSRGLAYDMLFGPAYKGIPLVSATAIALANRFDLDVPYAFNRKEVKTHGEGGQLVGAPLSGKVVIIDDVITAGTAIREVMPIVEQAGARAVAVMVALDRQEKGKAELSAIQEVERDYGIPVISIIQLQQLADYLAESSQHQALFEKVKAYRQCYGVTSHF